MSKPLRCRLGLHAYVQERHTDKQLHAPTVKGSAAPAGSARTTGNVSPCCGLAAASRARLMNTVMLARPSRPVEVLHDGCCLAG
jgi:hypothetical protein